MQHIETSYLLSDKAPLSMRRLRRAIAILCSVHTSLATAHPAWLVLSACPPAPSVSLSTGE
jgi:hypothetical protein